MPWQSIQGLLNLPSLYTPRQNRLRGGTLVFAVRNEHKPEHNSHAAHEGQAEAKANHSAHELGRRRARG